MLVRIRVGDGVRVRVRVGLPVALGLESALWEVRPAGCEAERSVGRGACGRESESEGLAAPRAADAPAESSAPPAGTNELVRCSPRSAPGASVSELPPPPPSPAAAAVPLPSSETREPEAEERLGVETTR